jgi:hypothetical protein
MRRCRVAFLHPDLGLGGAERLVVDAAVELAQQGHTVDMYTAYYDPERCFDETRSGAFAVVVAGAWFPRHVFGRCVALCAIIRCTLAALHLAARVWSGNLPDYDVIIVDQVAAVVPLLRCVCVCVGVRACAHMCVHACRVTAVRVSLPQHVGCVFRMCDSCIAASTHGALPRGAILVTRVHALVTAVA